MKTKFLTLLFAILFANVTASAQGTYTCGIFTFDAIITPPTCNGDCDGSIQIINLSGGTPSYFTLWSNGDTTPNPSGLCDGDYTVYISDAGGDTCSMVLNVPTPLPITFSLVVTNVSCYGSCDGSIYVDSLLGGVGSYTFQWNDPFLQTTATADSLCQGTYTLCVTDANGCVVCQSATIGEPAELQITENVTDASCSTCCDGAIVFIATGGTPNYIYTLNDSLGNSFFPPYSNLCPSTYTLCIMDANGCITCKTLVLSFPTAIKINADKIVFSIYPNPSTGIITLQQEKIYNEEVSVTIFSVLGKQVYYQENNNNIINISHLDNGVYYLQLTDKNNKRIVYEKITLQK